jgi:formylglycine-generating enzyme required for sulfatase activity
MRSLETRAIWWGAILSALVAFVAGCNGSSNTPKPDAAPQNASDQIAPLQNGAMPPGGNAGDAQNQAAAGNDDTPVVEKPAQKSKKTEKPSPLLDPAVNPHDVYAVAAAQPQFEIAGNAGTPVSADTFTVVAPPKGLDSTRYELANPVQPAPSAAPMRTTAPVEVLPAPVATSPLRASKSRSPKASKSAPKQAEPKKTEVAEASGAKALPSGFTALPSAKKSRFGWPLRIRCDRDGAEMALVTGGAVTVGHDGGPPESSPQITVVLDSFYMDVTEVTLRQYERFREAMKEEKGRNVVSEVANASSPPDYPVLGVTLLQTQFYARWAGKEIPTEAEWERAARGEDAFDHPWGNGRAIWKEARTPEDIGPVKSFRTDISPFGIYDLAGNAREWCLDRYSPTAFADVMKASHASLRNWKGPRIAKPADSHVVKGNGPNWQSWYRIGVKAVERRPDVGFRCVLHLAGKND